MQLNSLKDVYVDQIADLYSAEQQLVEALPKVQAAVGSTELEDAVSHHLEETREHLRRLEGIIDELGAVPHEECEAMKGLIAEGEEIIQASGSTAAKDAALIGAAQRIEHYEIAGYGTAHALARELGFDDAASVLDSTLSEEMAADKLLSKIATGGLFSSGVNEAAAGSRR
jgi:ferritin-like metal-binding protein YciE